MEEFAQTRAPDDLFDDDVTPVTPTAVSQQQQQQPPPPQIPTGPRVRGNNIARGSRGRGRGSSDFRTPSGREQSQPSPGPNVANDTTSITPDTSQDRPAAVRGDRTLTGGVQKPKLSEEQLTERMQQISLKNNSLLAAHARAEADAASFAEREARDAAVAAQRKKVDRVNRQQMMGEREKNRQRKLDAVGGREWDMEKKEEDYAGRDSARGSGNRRGMHGGVGGVARGEYSSEYTNQQEPEQGGEGFRGRGRGGRGRYGSRRGGTQRDMSNKSNERSVPTESDFPELPPGVKPADSGPASKLSLPRALKDTKGTKEQIEANGTISNGKELNVDSRQALGKEDELQSPTQGQRSWADQVEAAGS